MPRIICLNCKTDVDVISIDRMYCSSTCANKYNLLKKKVVNNKENLPCCPCCKTIFTEDGKHRRGFEYPFLCIQCELLAFDGNYEKDIKKETRYL